MNLETVTPLYRALQRYVRWLDLARGSVAVRADVATLGIALANGADISAPLGDLDASIGRLPTGAMRAMLGATAAKIRRAAEDAGS